MEEENVIKTKQGNYITGMIGAIIGGFIGTIPWILSYVYGGMMLSLLAVLIAAGEFYGYKICKGKINKHLPKIIMILAIIIVTVTTLVIIPGLLIQKEGINVSLTNIQRLYSNGEFSSAIMQDFIVSVIFTILGASIVTANIKKQLENNDGKDIKLDLNNTEEVMKTKKESIELIKPIFTKYDATTKENAMMKEEVLAEIEDNKANKSFNYLKQLGIIKKYKGKYYYSEENEDRQTNTKKPATWKIVLKVFLIIAIILFVLIIIAAMMDDSPSSNTSYQDTNVRFEIGKDWNESEADYDTEWNFYKYISEVPVLNSENSIDEEDYSSYPAGINIYYDTANTESISSIEDVKTTVQSSIESTEDKPDTLNMDISKTSKNYDLLKVKIIYSSYPEEILYYYYILNGEQLSCITAYSFNLEDDEAIEDEADKLVNSFEWREE